MDPVSLTKSKQTSLGHDGKLTVRICFPGFPDNKVSTGFAPRPIACDRNNDIPGKHPDSCCQLEPPFGALP
ncbi:MAG: hypothetical protein QOH96_2139 [Blastocatellia bacterium]|nr:hypothetical protein [Blastocatellia bacterium]